MCQPKLRRGVKPQPVHRFPLAKPIANPSTINNPTSKFTLPKRSSPDSPGVQAKYITRMPNNSVTKHFVSTSSPDDRSSTSFNQRLQRNPTTGSLSQVIQNYLNQTLPIPNAQTRDRRIPIKSRLNDRSTIAASANFDYPKQALSAAENHRLKSAPIRGQTAKSHPKHNGIQKSTTASRGTRSVSNYSQNHGVITASAYKDLRNAVTDGSALNTKSRDVCYNINFL